MPPPAAILWVDRATGSLEKQGLTGVSDDPSRFLLNCHFPGAGRPFVSCSVFRRSPALSPRTGRSRYRFPLRIGASRHSNLICMRFLCLAVRLPVRVRVIGTPAFPGVRGRRPSALGEPPGGTRGRAIAAFGKSAGRGSAARAETRLVVPQVGAPRALQVQQAPGVAQEIAPVLPAVAPAEAVVAVAVVPAGGTAHPRPAPEVGVWIKWQHGRASSGGARRRPRACRRSPAAARRDRSRGGRTPPPRPA